MWLSDTAVRRPVLAIVINLMLITFGMMAFRFLSLREYPNVNPPIVSVNTTYPGASAAIVETRITQILEDRISGISGIRSISSSSSNGRSNITIEFNSNRDIDAAANDVRDRISRATGNLPDEVDPPEVSKADSDEDVIIWFNLLSDSMSTLELSDYARRYLEDRFSSLDGVARVRLGGGSDYAMRINLNHDAMAARRVTITDIENALRRENIELPAGELRSTERQLTARVLRGYTSDQQFRELVLRKDDAGHLIRLGEVAEIFLGPAEDKVYFRGDGKDVIGIGIIKQSTANTLEVARAAKAEFARIKASLPPNMQIIPSYDSSVFIEQAISEVYLTLSIAMVLVIGVIYVFLGSLRATLIPAVTVPISLIGAFAILWALGFSINLLTLLALVLAIGLVVDDAIVVLENIHRRIEHGEKPLLAAFNGTREVGFAVIATTAVLISVFVPIVFLEGDLGKLFSEFALTIAGSVFLSAITALTLTPVMGAFLLKPATEHSGFQLQVEKAVARVEAGYGRMLDELLHHKFLFISMLVLVMICIAGLFKTLPAELAPKEDRAGIFVNVLGPEGATFEHTVTNVQAVEKMLRPYVDSGEFTRLLARAPGFGGNAMNSAFVVIGLSDFGTRRNGFVILDEVNAKLSVLPAVRAFGSIRQGLVSSGGGSPVSFVIGGDDYDEMARWRDVLLAKASDNPGFANVQADYKETLPQFLLTIDRNRAADLGVSVQAIGTTLQTLLSGRNMTTFNQGGEEYDVLVKGEEASFRTPDDLRGIYLRSEKTGELVSLANVVTGVEQAGPSTLNRYNRIRAITITANLVGDYTLSQALDFLNGVVRDDLDNAPRVDYKGESKRFMESAESSQFVFLLALLIVYLVLAAQFESFVHPFVIMLTVPLAVLGALAGLQAFGMTLNIYSQIGIVMLVGLAAKNGILIVEFANQMRDQGHEFDHALLEAAKRRLRPIVMTSFTAVMGAIPLILAHGAGSESRQVLGVVVFGGVLVSTILTLFVVPMAYSLLARNTGSPEAVARQLAALTQTEAGASREG
ncbi:efflux RND transporter permease subunit [Permianibacter sp. IMCC34836]|uniref:efflux RND transporter permease subunit n=1 Tax=Permianibacter fluminis TaxID=2738515 RepID=UPI00155541F3|nr:efflux RND transporter permease subunit [Permianibacter fluminis]NQD36112.1 efflux RND transporter permease subunit [Permianibacter fluminis]